MAHCRRLEARQIRWGVISNKLEYLVHSLMDRLDLSHRAVLAFGGDSAPRPKPAPDLMQRALKETGLTGKQCIYIGDDQRDILAGRAVGMTTIAAAYGYCNPAEAANWGADHLVNSVAEFHALLQGLA